MIPKRSHTFAASGTSLASGSQSQPNAGARNIPEVSMEDLLSGHLEARAARMFEQEEEEARRDLNSTTPAAAPSAIIEFVPYLTQPPPPRPLPMLPVTASRHSSLPYYAGSHRTDWERTDRRVRTNALNIIESVMTNPDVEAIAGAVTLEEVLEQCRAAGVPFGELLEQEVDGTVMVPLEIEITRCDFDEVPELLLFLLEHTSGSKKLLWYLRRGCMRRDDDLYERLRHIIPTPSYEPWDPPPFDYHVVLDQHRDIAQDSGAFNALVSIPNFAFSLRADGTALDRRRQIHPEKRGRVGGPDRGWSQRTEAGLVIDVIALARCWTLEIGRNTLILTLVDGDKAVVHASLTLVQDENEQDAPSVRESMQETAAAAEKQDEEGRAATGGHLSVDPEKEDFDLCDGVSSLYPSPDPSRSNLGSPRSIPSDSPPQPPRPSAFFFPSTILHPLHVSGQHTATITRCYPAGATPSDFVEAARRSSDLLFQLSVALGDRPLPTVSDTNRTEPERAAAPGWSVVDDGDEFDSDDGEIEYATDGGNEAASEVSDFADLGVAVRGGESL